MNTAAQLPFSFLFSPGPHPYSVLPSQRVGLPLQLVQKLPYRPTHIPPSIVILNPVKLTVRIIIPYTCNSQFSCCGLQFFIWGEAFENASLPLVLATPWPGMTTLLSPGLAFPFGKQPHSPQAVPAPFPLTLQFKSRGTVTTSFALCHHQRFWHSC